MAPTVITLLLLGFVLGMRHATDADHVVAVTTIVSRERTVRSAAWIGAFWGLGHTVTLFAVGGAIVLLGVVVPPRVGLSMELSVAVMLLLLGGVNLLAGAHAAKHAQRAPALAGPPAARADEAPVAEVWTDRWLRGRLSTGALRPLVIGVVHGLAGSAALALLVLATVKNLRWALAYLLVFGVGTIAGMTLVTALVAVPIAMAARRFGGANRWLGPASGLVSVVFGAFLVYQIGVVDGLFAGAVASVP